MSEFRPRPGQQRVLAYRAGKMGICAVPGSGKTRTLAELAARLVIDAIAEDQEVLVVTLVNSAVDNFRHRINDAIKRHGLLPGSGYRVRTLHGLAHDIVRERPGLVGLSEDFGIIDEREAEAILGDAVDTWLQSHPDSADRWLAPEVEGKRSEWVKRERWPKVVQELALAFIKRAKDLRLTPELLLASLQQAEVTTLSSGDAWANPLGDGLELARMGTEIYANYQRSLAYRGVVDFDDLIRLSLEALERDPAYLSRLRSRWVYVLEDEAQDSSQIQEQILRKLVGENGNWVRVGDPNQAIYETFTTADPGLLQAFLREEGIRGEILPESGRLQPAIIELANRLVDWVRQAHPVAEVRQALMPLHIRPTLLGDPQPNPPANAWAVQMIAEPLGPTEELRWITASVARWLADQAGLPPEMRETCAVLSPRNERGFEIITLFKQGGIPYVELLRSTSATREAAGALGNVLHALADPTSARKLSVAFRVWRRQDRGQESLEAPLLAAQQHIAGCPAVEAYLWPRADRDWLSDSESELPDEPLALLADFREVARRWHRAADLPIDQLILTLAADLFQEPADLALAHKLALLLRDVAESHPTYRLAELVRELAAIARNERRFLGFSGEETGFEPPKGTVTVATMHKAKGLEWDRVYLMSVNSYDFPAGWTQDTYIAEPWFVRDRLNLQAEAIEQLETLKAMASDLGQEQRTSAQHAAEGVATARARLAYARERIRLLYVGITRARRELFITWNTGRANGQKRQPAVPLVALQAEWEQRLRESGIDEC